MAKKSISQSIRFPPFDSSNWIANALPITKKKIESTDYAPNFIIETDDGWLIEQLSSDKKGIYEGDFPEVVHGRRVGWHLVPNKIHQRARNLIRYSVAILLISLLYLAFTPLMEWIGIPTFGTRSVRLGLLDYPLLATIVVPMMLIPILMRIGANFHDLRRQNSFLKETPPSPEIEIEPCSSDKNLVGKISFQTIPEEWGRMTVSWRVGILSPVREAIMEAQGRTLTSQPSPGLSTALPFNTNFGLDDGTGVGEDTPMETKNTQGGMFLRPMRIMALGGQSDFSSGENFELTPPNEIWPGTCYSKLVRVHWELVIKIRREEKGPILWVHPLIVGQNVEKAHVKNAHLVDGRTEILVYIPN